MSALFPRWTNTAARASLLAGVGGIVGSIALLFIYVRSPLFVQSHTQVEQPVEFDHRHHAGDNAMDCRYCHSSVERSASAGIPPTSLCLNCHSQVWNKSGLLDPIRRDWFDGRPIPWRRVHRLPDYVYFNHSIHVAKGVGCVTCHDRVDKMAAVEQRAPLTMNWCLDCHRAPAKNLRPRELITSMTWVPDGDPEVVGRALAQQYGVHTRVSCTTCHR